MRFARTSVLALVATSLVVTAPSSPVSAEVTVVAGDMLEGSTSSNLVSYSGDVAFSSAGDGFGKFQRGVSSSIPFAVLDDSLATFPADSGGIVDDNNLDEFFGATDTINGDNPDDLPYTATWVFDTSGVTDPMNLTVDIGAMGDFETSDTFEFAASIDSATATPLITPTVDEDATLDYTLAGGAVFTEDDPLAIGDTYLNNVLTTFSAPIDGSGDQLTITFTASTDGGSEALAFQTLAITTGDQDSVECVTVAGDMLEGSTSSNLVSYSGDVAFSSAGDGFGKFQRGVSSSIPFAVLDDSLATFPADSGGIVDDNNLDEFFGATDTINGDNPDDLPYTATWVFDTSGVTDPMNLTVDIGAMGDFETSDTFEFAASIDSATATPLITPTVDEDATLDYTLAGGAVFTEDDPLAIGDTYLNNVLTTFSAPIDGSGDQLTITFTASTDGGSEALAFQTLAITTGDCTDDGGGDPDPDPEPVEAKIHEVQGASDTDSMVDARVIIEGVVVGDYEGPAPALRGFFVQEEDGDADDDPETSEGIFVFNFDNDDVELGDVVQVEGTVEERFGNTQLTDFVEVTVLEGESRTATPAGVTFPTETSNSLEAFEGMAVTIEQPMVISEYYQYDDFGDVVVAAPALGADRPMVPTAVYGSDTQDALDLAELNDRSRVTIDDANTFSWIDDPIHPINRQPFSRDNSFRGGDSVTGLTGPVFYSFSAYRILPYEIGGYDTYTPTERPATPEDVGGSVRVAALNALNYFLTPDTGASLCGPGQDQDCRGANNAEELQRQREKLISALAGLDADVIGLMEIENTLGVEPLADIASGLNDVLGADTFDYIAAGEDAVVGTDAIKVGLLYRTDAVLPIGDTAVLDDTMFLDPNDTGSPKNRAAVAASFVDLTSGGVVSVVVNHLKSKGSGCGAGDDDPLAGSCNLTRTLAAQQLATWLDGNPTGIADTDWIIAGDLNAYDKEDPIAALQTAGYTDLVAAYQGEFAYSYVFDGEFGYLDYLMSSSTLTPQVTGTTEWHINADEPDVFDYDTSDKSAYQASLFDGNTPFRSSDHDAALSGLALETDAEVVIDWVSGQIDELEASGSLSEGQANSVRKSLDQALRQLDRGHVNGAVGILTGVSSHLADFLADGVLTPAEADALIAAIDALRSGLS